MGPGERIAKHAVMKDVILTDINQIAHVKNANSQKIT
jgi:hypothetical protein